MAITYQKPVKEWYTEATSQWTLDYPPLFAWFEFLLSKLAQYFDQEMLTLTNLNYQSAQTVFFMRFSVILSDIIYCYGVNRFFNLVKNLKKSKNEKDPWHSAEVVLAMLLLWNPGLLLVDHIHFQYNGFLNGFLLMSIADVFEGHFIRAALWYSVLLNLKHIYLYLAPAYFLFMLKNYCYQTVAQKSSTSQFSLTNFMKLAGTGIFVVALSFGPFIYMGQLTQVLSRMFPVKRGLTHSYWAPNAWALYSFLDWILSRLAPYFYPSKPSESCFTRGLVRECDPTILPRVTPEVTFLLAFAALAPVFWILWRKKEDKFRVFLDSIILCAFASFLFGYHVHEKAILLVIIPLTISGVLYAETTSIFAFLSIVGHFSLFPLLHKEGETLLKILLLSLHIVYIFSSLAQLHRLKPLLVTPFESLYLCGLLVLQLLYSFSGIEQKLPFLPLMLISTYCAMGIVYAWIKYCYISMDIYQASKTEKIRKRR